MSQQCFIKSGSKPSVCGVHNVPLVERRTIKEEITGWVGNFTYFVCPVSGQVPQDTATQS